MRGRSFSFVIRCEDVLTFVTFPGVSGSFSIIGVEMIIKSRNNNFTHTEACPMYGRSVLCSRVVRKA